MWLTQSFLKDETSRVFSKKVFNTMNNWEEVTEYFKMKWEAEHPVELPEEMIENN